MSDWRDRILREFTPRVARLTLVADPDGLLLEETLLEAIRERGFEILPFDDSVAFRFAYESRFRSGRDGGETPDLVVALRAERHDLATLPYDLLRAGRQLSFGLGELFPGLSHPVVASLDHGHLDALCRARMRHGPERLGDDATKDFALLHVFDIAPALIRGPVDLLRTLLRRHYRGQRLPRLLDDRLVRLLRQGGAFDSWPLETIVPDRDAFFAFLQERWPLFLDRLDRLAWHAGTSVRGVDLRLGRGTSSATASARHTGTSVGEVGKPYGLGIDGPRDASGSFGLKLEGPADLPFGHDDVRIYIDNLFVEGMLRPVPHGSSGALSGQWVSVGIRTDPDADKRRRLQGLMETAGKTIPGPDARHREWTAFACRWADLEVLRSGTAAPARSETGTRVAELRREVDRSFLAWTGRRYAGLHNQPPDPPVMVHHVPPLPREAA